MPVSLLQPPQGARAAGKWEGLFVCFFLVLWAAPLALLCALFIDGLDIYGELLSSSSTGKQVVRRISIHTVVQNVMYSFYLHDKITQNKNVGFFKHSKYCTATAAVDGRVGSAVLIAPICANLICATKMCLNGNLHVQ